MGEVDEVDEVDEIPGNAKKEVFCILLFSFFSLLFNICDNVNVYWFMQFFDDTIIVGLHAVILFSFVCCIDCCHDV